MSNLSQAYAPPLREDHEGRVALHESLFRSLREATEGRILVWYLVPVADTPCCDSPRAVCKTFERSVHLCKFFEGD